MYNTETAGGDTIADSIIDRNDVFQVTKVLQQNFACDDVIRSVEECLRWLGTHIDLLLIHSPSTTVPIEESVEAMNHLQSEGKVNLVEHFIHPGKIHLHQPQ